MNSITIYGLMMLCGVCVYATINHLSIGLRRPYSELHLYFAGLCLAVVFAALGRIEAYQALTVTQFVNGLRWNLSFVTIAMMSFHWVIAGFSNVRPRNFLVTMTMVFLALFVWNLFAPYTLQFSYISHLGTLRLPWGETVARPVGQISPSFRVTGLAMMVDFGFCLYALGLAWRRDRAGSSLAMLLAISVFVLTAIEGIAARSGAIHFIQLGWIGFLAMIITMSFVLNHDTQQRIRNSERRFRSLLEQSPFSIQVFSPDGRSRQVNPAWEKLWGFRTDVHAPTYNILKDPVLVENGVMPYIEKGFAGEAADIPPVLHKLLDIPDAPCTENGRWLRSYIYPIRDKTDSIIDVILMHEDVTYKKHVEDAIRLIAEGISSAVDEQFFQQLVNNLARAFEADYACIALQDKDDPKLLKPLASCLQGDITSKLEVTHLCGPLFQIMRDGPCLFSHNVKEKFPEDKFLDEVNVDSIIGTPLPPNNHQPGLLVVMHSKPLAHIEQAKQILDIFAARASAELQRQASEVHIRNLAYQDYLTGLANRAQLHERLNTIMRQAEHGKNDGALLLIDLDHFKTINDALGHDVGDEVLMAVASRVTECCYDNDFLARFGGDEFVVLTQRAANIDNNQFRMDVASLAQSIQSQLANPIMAGDRSFTLGASIGIVYFPEDGETDLDVLRHADMALYQAKSKGRGIIQTFLPDLEITATKRLEIEAGLRTAIEKNEMELYFQPQVDKYGNLIGAETLLRWKHGDSGYIPPDTFIPVAEETGLIHHIGAWVFDQACGHLVQWHRQGYPFSGHLSINVCPWQFARPDFIDEIKGTLRKHDVDAEQLMLELTETALLYDVSDTIEKLHALRQLGLRIALDDFGTGYSSLAYLRDLPLDQLKIDKSFVNELLSTVEHPLVESMIAIGRHMKLDVVAEGVETSTQREKLIELGCEQYQGYLFCRPIPEQDFLDWIRLNYSKLSQQI